MTHAIPAPGLCIAVLAPAPAAVEALESLYRVLGDHRDLVYLYWQNLSAPWHLLVTVLLLAGLFFGRLTLAARRLRRARAGIPLVIGGWGTRGKSGVERKKSALFAALGCDVVTKTTGCEAMFIHAQPGVKPLELFIYRPYDKATIWEQQGMVELARELDAHVFLYECMALNPQYVRIIQEDWMRDDLSTITNTYPDHEDIQGPAGIDLPYVMGEFVPRGATCFTAEESMLPVLRECARRKGTALDGVRWREAALIPEDVLARYPYNVHPLNLALVTRMARHLGIERDFVWKEVADHIVPDLGVLKVFPVASHRGRRLEFSNGHSANERHGFNANWQRLGLDAYDAVATPERWLITVVNNRHDRIARSKVFADVLTQDVRVHAHVLIGTNLNGLNGYMAQSLRPRLAGVSLAAQRSIDAALARLDRELADLMFEVPTEEALLAKLEVLLAGAGAAEEVAVELARAPGLRIALAESGQVRSGAIDPLLPDRRDTPVTTALARALDDLERGAIEHGGASPQLAAEARAWFLRYVREHNSVEALRTRVRVVVGVGRPEASEELDDACRELLKGLFMRKLLPIHDAHVSGDRIVDFIARHVPPGHFVHIHGCQNIKGPGLDWVYRWINLDAVHRACAELEDHRSDVRMDALVRLATNTDYGILDAPFALEAVRASREKPYNQDMAFQTQADLALEHIEQRLRAARDAVAGTVERAGLLARIAGAALDGLSDVLEKVLDAGDSKARRRAADEVRRALVARRMGHDRAAAELRAIVRRQKGGWLRQAIARRLRLLRESLGLPERRLREAHGERD